MRYVASVTLISVMTIGRCLSVDAHAAEEWVSLVVQTGTPLHVLLDRRVTIERVNQVVTGQLAEPVYVYDRLVLAAGAPVRGRIAALERPSRLAQIHAFASGDFSPHRHIVLQFDTVGRPDGSELAIHTIVTQVTERPALKVAAAPEQTGVVARARQEVAERASEALDTITAPGKLERLKDAIIDRLPYHRQYLRKGTICTAELLTPIDFGQVRVIAFAPAGTSPAPDSLLHARLLTTLDSSKSERGTTLRAMVTHPVFSPTHELILPEGFVLEGTVTLARPARHFHRNGQLRFLIQHVHPPNADATPLLASLFSVRTNDADSVVIDDEGGAAVTNSKTRFIAPALSILALRAATHREPDELDPGDPIPTTARFDYGNPGLGGFFGWGLAGVVASQLSRPVGLGLSIVGVVRTVYGSVFGKGREVVFPVNTPIELQLAPGHPTGQ